MVLDFREIPQANTNTGLQDTFELFSRDFFEDIGFKILHHPDRGADGKKDIIISETRQGVIGETSIKWLVSCKHYAHSGNSVTQSDEPDILDRVNSHQCDGFIGFYSTLPAASLNSKLNGIRGKIEFQIFDKERIEKELLSSKKGINLAERFFPKSIAKFKNQNPKPVRIFMEEPQILCDYCGKNLLDVKNGMFVALAEHMSDFESNTKYELSNVKDVYFSCRGVCDSVLKQKNEIKGLYDIGWEDIDDLLIPNVYLRNIISFINQLTEEGIEKRAIEKMKRLYINIFPHIARELTEKEKDRLIGLNQIWSAGF